MGLKVYLAKNKLQKVEREYRKLHGLQKRTRGHLDDLEAERKKGTLDAAAYEDRKAKLEARRHELIERLKSVEAEVHRMQAEVKALGAAP